MRKKMAFFSIIKLFSKNKKESLSRMRKSISSSKKI